MNLFTSTICFLAMTLSYAVSPPVKSWSFTSCPTSNTYASSNSSVNIQPLNSTTPSAVICDFDYGITMNQTYPNASYLGAPINDFQRYFQQNGTSTGLSVSMWVRSMMDYVLIPQPIVTFGSLLPKPAWVPGCPGYMLQISQYRNNLLIGYEDQDQSESCRILWLKHNPMSVGDLVHLVISFNSSRTNAYINGVPVAWDIKNNFDPTLSTWDANNYLQILGNAQVNDTFSGTLLQLDIFDYGLNATESQSLFESGVTYGQHDPLYLQSFPPPEFIIPQDNAYSESFVLSSRNVSRSGVELALQFLTFPQHGKLINPTADFINVNASLIPMPFGTSNVTIYYKLDNQSYFDYPSVDPLGNKLNITAETVEYRFVAHDHRGQILDVSPIMILPILVEHVNHAPSLVVPEKALIKQFQDDPTLVIVQGIKVIDYQDYDTSYIRVDVTCDKGKLSLQKDHLNLANFSFCNERDYTPWQCVGTGVGDRLMTFMALPSQVELILHSMEYRGFSPGEPDQIQVSIYDGEGGDCLSPVEHFKLSNNVTSTIHHGCTTVTAEFPVPPFPYSTDVKEHDILGIPNTDFHHFGIADALFWILFFTFLCGCIGCFNVCCKCLHCFTRGGKVEADDNPRDDLSSLDLSSSSYSSSQSISSLKSSSRSLSSSVATKSICNTNVDANTSIDNKMHADAV